MAKRTPVDVSVPLTTPLYTLLGFGLVFANNGRKQGWESASKGIGFKGLYEGAKAVLSDLVRCDWVKEVGDNLEVSDALAAYATTPSYGNFLRLARCAHSHVARSGESLDDIDGTLKLKFSEEFIREYLAFCLQCNVIVDGRIDRGLLANLIAGEISDDAESGANSNDAHEPVSGEGLVPKNWFRSALCVEIWFPESKVASISDELLSSALLTRKKTISRGFYRVEEVVVGFSRNLGSEEAEEAIHFITEAWQHVAS